MLRIALASIALAALLASAALAAPAPSIRADAFLSGSTVEPGQPIAYSVVVSDSADESVSFDVAVSYDAGKLRAGPVVRFPRYQPCDGAACVGSFGAPADAGKDRVFTFLFSPVAGACGEVAPLVATVTSGSYTIRVVSEPVAINCSMRLPIVQAP